MGLATVLPQLLVCVMQDFMQGNGYGSGPAAHRRDPVAVLFWASSARSLDYCETSGLTFSF